MRELTRSMIRFSWVMPLLGMDQVVSLVIPGKGRGALDSATATLDALAEVASQQMGPRLRELYEQGDELQRRVVHGMFGMLGMGNGDGESKAEPWRPVSSKEGEYEA